MKKREDDIVWSIELHGQRIYLYLLLELTLLQRQLMKRFGPISDSTHARLKAATQEQIQTWAERILDARNLAEVFNDH